MLGGFAVGRLRDRRAQNVALPLPLALGEQGWGGAGFVGGCAVVRGRVKTMVMS